MAILRTLLGQLALILVALFVAGTLVLPYNGGYVLAYALMALTLLQIVGLIIARGRWHIDAAGWCLLAALALIATAFATSGDIAMAVNFSFLLAFIPLASWLRRFAAPDSAAVVSWLALTGSALSTVTAVHDVIIQGKNRAQGWWSDPIWSAEAALILGFMALVAFPVMKSRWRFLLLAGPLLGLTVVFLSGSRGPLLAAPVIVFVLMVTTFRRWWKQAAMLAVLVGVAGAVTLAASPGIGKRLERTGTVIVQLLTTGEIKERSGGARLAFWRAGTQAFLAQPLTGYGWSNRVDAAYEYLPDKGKSYERKGHVLRGNTHLHADVLDMGVAGGIMGLLAYALILLAPLMGAMRSVQDGQYQARLTGALVLASGYAACGVTYLMFGYEFHTTLFVCLAAIVVGFCRDAPSGPRLSPAAQ